MQYFKTRVRQFGNYLIRSVLKRGKDREIEKAVGCRCPRAIRVSSVGQKLVKARGFYSSHDSPTNIKLFRQCTRSRLQSAVKFIQRLAHSDQASRLNDKICLSPRNRLENRHATGKEEKEEQKEDQTADFSSETISEIPVAIPQRACTERRAGENVRLCLPTSIPPPGTASLQPHSCEIMFTAAVLLIFGKTNKRRRCKVQELFWAKM
ncbi:hypothetical protein K0M31_018628 [Melipona bicolor]|uniref:Uncharacterized protein n=1 Tax=Melipona bicolor TaxID=60889 RepID=A0AA40KRU9_9HYME|nr:hypothetical protein K0M31_018628 [Melipona bicolor]